MSGTDAERMEASVAALGDRYDGLAEELFDTFMAVHPQYAFAFVNPAAARERMTRETLEALLALAAGEPWVRVAVTNFVDLHRNYAAFSVEDYRAWLALTVRAVERRSLAAWDVRTRAAWARQCDRLNEIIGAELARDWAHKKSLAPI